MKSVLKKMENYFQYINIKTNDSVLKWLFSWHLWVQGIIKSDTWDQHTGTLIYIVYIVYPLASTYLRESMRSEKAASDMSVFS